MEVSDQFVLFPRPLWEKARVRGSKNYAHPHLCPLPSRGKKPDWEMCVLVERVVVRVTRFRNTLELHDPNSYNLSSSQSNMNGTL